MRLPTLEGRSEKRYSTILADPPWSTNMAVAAAASPEDAPSAELTALINQRPPRLASYAGFLAVVVIVFLMVVKPFSN